MATLTGVNGKVVVGDGPTINVTEFEADIQRDLFDDSHFDPIGDGTEGNARSKVGGMSKCVGRLTGWMRSGTMPGIGTMATEHDAAGGEFNLIADMNGTGADIGYEFNGLMGDMTVDVIKIGLVAVSCSFESQGLVAAYVA